MNSRSPRLPCLACRTAAAFRWGSRQSFLVQGVIQICQVELLREAVSSVIMLVVDGFQVVGRAVQDVQVCRGHGMHRKDWNSRSQESGANSAGTGIAPARKMPLFMTLKGGLQQMTERLAAAVEKYRIFVRRRVLVVEFAPGGPGGAGDSCSRRFQIACEGGKVFDTDAVILAVPAYLAGGLVSPLDYRLSELLEGVPYSSSMTVSLGFDERAPATLPAGFGFLVPRQEQRRMLACTFVHAKFNHRAPEGKAMLRCFLGGARDPDVLGLSDEDVVTVVRRELQEIMNFTAEPLFFRVHRWHASMAQYPVGHSGHVASAIEERVQDVPGLYLAGMPTQESASQTASGPARAPRRKRWILWDWGRRRSVGSGR